MITACNWTSFFKQISGSTTLDNAVLANGTKLLGHVPHIAPFAYLHSIFPALTGEEAIILENQIGILFPPQLIDFYSAANGLNLFSGELSIAGMRNSSSRDIESILGQPFDLRTKNLNERAKWAQPRSVFIGFYKADGSLASIDSDGIVCRSVAKNGGVIDTWDSLHGFLECEFGRISRQFDGLGQKI